MSVISFFEYCELEIPSVLFVVCFFAVDIIGQGNNLEVVQILFQHFPSKLLQTRNNSSNSSEISLPLLIHMNPSSHLPLRLLSNYHWIYLYLVILLLPQFTGTISTPYSIWFCSAMIQFLVCCDRWYGKRVGGRFSIIKPTNGHNFIILAQSRVLAWNRFSSFIVIPVMYAKFLMLAGFFRSVCLSVMLFDCLATESNY